MRSGSEVEEKAFLSQQEANGTLQDKPYCRTLFPLTSHYVTKQCTRSTVQTRGGAPALDSYNSRAERSPERKMHAKSTLEATCSHTLSVMTKCFPFQRGKKKQKPQQFPGKLNYVREKPFFFMKPGSTDPGAVYPPGQTIIDSYLQKKMNPHVSEFVHPVK